MAVRQMEYPRFSAPSLPGGKVEVFVAGTSTKTTVWSDADKSSELSNPVILDSNGEAEIWFEGPVKIVLKNADDVQQWTIDDVPSDIPPTDVGRFNLIENGSFEIDADGDNLPDDWDITEDDATSTVELDSTNVAHGANSLKFVSQGSGGGTATTTNFFSVSAGKTATVAFTIKSTVADVRNQVQVRYFDKDQSFISADTVYDEDTSNPTSFEEKRFVSSVPATATFAKLKLVGCDPSDATSGTTYFDDTKVFTDSQAQFTNLGDSAVTATAADLNNIAGVVTTEGDLIVGDASGDASRLAVGASETVPESDGSTVSYAFPRALKGDNVQVFTSSGTLDMTGKQARVIGAWLIGGGGGGAGGGNSSGEEGGGGASSPMLIGFLQVDSDETLTVTVGTGGSGGNSGVNPVAGNDGGDSSISGNHGTVTCPGGSGSPGHTAGGAVAAPTSSGLFALAGVKGEDGQDGSRGGDGADMRFDLGIGGEGGTSAAGSNGAGIGSGGGGGDQQDADNFDGGDGADGRIVIVW